MLPWKTIIRLTPDTRRAVYLQIADDITAEISSGRVTLGTKLPSSRLLAEQLQLNRKTVQLAYDELLSQGWIEIIPYKGTFVKKNLPILKPKPLGFIRPSSPKSPTTLAVKTHQINDGTPDYRITPVTALYKTARFLTESKLSKSVLTGSHFAGHVSLRQNLAKYLNDTRALTPTANDLIITRGSQMSIFLACSVILSPGDRVIVGHLNYESANETIRYLGGQLVPVKVTRHGLDIDQIESIIVTQKIKAIYISPHHHYPTTVTMPIEHRLKLLALAQHHGFYILEDDYDYDYHYAGSPILPIASIDQGQQVIYIGSFSKILAPSIRMGYMYAHPDIISRCITIRKLIDRRGDPIIEKSLSILIEDGDIQRSIKKAVKIYRDRRDLFCKTLQHKFSDQVSFETPDGGMAVWVKFHNLKVKTLKETTLKQHLHLDVDTYSEEDKCRLGFASLNEDEIEHHLTILQDSIHRLKHKNT
ncbi:PLP-dependent aminotransferase family protein [Reichenbachiella agariperforans]|uniref:MocR-like pyridoxine biosynthesis transcription factor PdxR n=1 Tax=Reichenbachiella agariperforans TaxID=156994 RepID=UPI001C0A42AA|nr:PLP-dependent aminotransferase family protein [Reichenbachiella agariperforans]MBU2912490.1 PLP-dependent aminotransferase family protein [Reichenbachiella agariperforans]